VKDDGGYAHGYRVIDVHDHGARVHNYTPTTTTIPKYIHAGLGPVYINVYDSEGRYTGHGSAIVEIPHSYYTGCYDDTTAQAIILYDTTLSYRYQVRGAKAGYYSMAIASISGTDTTKFWAKEIPIDRRGIYQYKINWEALSRGEKGVTVEIDTDGDGTFERTIITGDSLAKELITPPTGSSLSNDNVYFYPNPFNPDNELGAIRYSLSVSGNITIKIYDASNRLVRTIDCGHKEAGTELSKDWDGRTENGDIAANGVYFYIIESSAGERAVGKIAVLR
jgi:hypothetical protein